jgi:hypothetical protein
MGYSEKADAFVEVFKTGLPSYPGDAAHALRERIIQNRDKLTAYNRNDTIRALVQCWKNFQNGTPVRIIRIVDDFRIKGWTPERLGL